MVNKLISRGVIIIIFAIVDAIDSDLGTCKLVVCNE